MRHILSSLLFFVGIAFATIASAIPPPNQVTLSIAQNQQIRNGCVVTAFTGFNQSPTPGFTIKLDRLAPGPVTTIASGPANNNGKRNFAVPFNTTVIATVQSFQLLSSNTFACGSRNNDRDRPRSNRDDN